MTEFQKTSTPPGGSGVRPGLRNTGVSVARVLGLLGRGYSEKDVLQIHAELTQEDVREALARAARKIDTLDYPRTQGDNATWPPTPTKSYPAQNIAKPPRALSPSFRSESSPATHPDPSPGEEPPLLLYHPSHPDKPTVTVSRDGLRDRRWSQATIAWCDIKDIQRIRGAKTILVTLDHPERYIATMPFFKRFLARLRLLFNIKELFLDTSSLGIRTKELNAVVHRFWLRYRGTTRRRKRRRKEPLQPIIPFP